ncbi:MAG: hypothetical protein K940chlam3_01199 [Chlamydiae bacterium]|nr:hypothetical protein [Chlamydiota bacterium]
MNKNPYLLGFLCLILVATLWIGGKSAWGVYRYLHLSQVTSPETLMISIKKKSSNHYIPTVQYNYQVKGKEFQGKQDLNHIKYFREEYLENDLSKIKKEEKWTIYYDPANPSRSSLKREFPYKNVAYSFIMVGLLGYFIWLGIFTQKN